MQVWAALIKLALSHSGRNIVGGVNHDQTTKPHKDGISTNMLIVTLGATPGIIWHHSHLLSTTWAKVGGWVGEGWGGLIYIKKKYIKSHTLHSLSRARERRGGKKPSEKQISVQMCSFDMRNRNRSLCAERIKTWAVSWLGLCTPIGLWNDLHLHKVHAQTHRRARTRRATCRPTAQIHSTVRTARGEGRKKRLLHKA